MNLNYLSRYTILFSKILFHDYLMILIHILHCDLFRHAIRWLFQIFFTKLLSYTNVTLSWLHLGCLLLWLLSAVSWRKCCLSTSCIPSALAALTMSYVYICFCVMALKTNRDKFIYYDIFIAYYTMMYLWPYQRVYVLGLSVLYVCLPFMSHESFI